MPEYLAKYTIYAGIYDAGTFMDDPEPRMQEYRFNAEKDEAEKLAEKFKDEFHKKYFGIKSISLDSLLEVNEVKLSST